MEDKERYRILEDIKPQLEQWNKDIENYYKCMKIFNDIEKERNIVDK